MIHISTTAVSDVDKIVEIHNQAFPEFFLTTLGSGFLRLYYRCMSRNTDAVTLCAREDGRVVGFATTALRSAGFNTKLIKRNMVGFVIEGVKLMFSRPKAMVRLLRNMTKGEGSIGDSGDYAELFSISVSPTCQGKGIGRLLLAETEVQVRHRGG